jgi:hypothetical protein
MGFGMNAALGMLGMWEVMARDLERLGLVVGDGVVSALAAKAYSMNVVSAWGDEEFARALSHEYRGGKVGGGYGVPHAV